MDLLPVSTPEELINRIRVLQRVRETLGVDTPDEIVDSVTDLQERVHTLKSQQAALKEAGFDLPEYALDAIQSMEQQLDQLYNEKAVTEQTDQDEDVRQDGDTFDQLQALLAREEKLKRQLGVSNPDDIIEMVEGLKTQLEDVYQDWEDDFDIDAVTSASQAESSDASTESDRLSVLEDELGVSDPDAIVAMMNDLTDQLEELYSGRQRLTEFNLNGADDAIKMVQNMQQQLEALYEQREQMSDHGIQNVNHALSMIESMESQLNELQEAPSDIPNENGLSDLEDANHRLESLQEKLSSLTEEKDRLRQKRDQLQDDLDTLADELGTQDPTAITDLVRSMEDQLEDIYQERKQDETGSTATEPFPLLEDDTLAHLDEIDEEALDDLPVGVFGLDAQNVVQQANEAALEWPDVTADTPSALLERGFFEEVAPAARNNLFQGRLDEAAENGLLNELFLYTYVAQDAPLTNLAVHLYSASDRATNWIVFQVQEKY